MKKIISLLILSALIGSDYYFLQLAITPWVVGAIAALVVYLILAFRFAPKTVGKISRKLLQIAKKLPESRKITTKSDDWSEWFAQQSKDGFKITFENENHKTPWSDEVSPDNVHPEYPRPQLVRDRWINLNGLWNFNVINKDVESNKEFPGQILVPFPVESALSGINRPIYATERMWYKRTFVVPTDWKGERIILNFGAVDWEAKVYVNGALQVEHVGGYTPFSADITDAVEFNKDNEIVVVVYDPTDAYDYENNEGLRQLGKQSLHPDMITYSAVSGIWQTVWLEPAPAHRIERIVTTNCNVAEGYAEIAVDSNLGNEGLTARITLKEDGSVYTNKATRSVMVEPANLKLWTPDTPYLYEVTVELLDGETVLDSIETYFAIREVGKKKVNGNVVFTINDEPIFHHGPLDQGYFPDGQYTAPTDEALAWDLVQTKEMGFNMTRKHIKVEPARWYYHADRLGIMVWQDMIGNYDVHNADPDQFFAYISNHSPLGHLREMVIDHDAEANGRSKESQAQFYKELTEMVEMTRFFPSVVVWSPFNEFWGQFKANAAVDLIRNIDHIFGTMTDECEFRIDFLLDRFASE